MLMRTDPFRELDRLTDAVFGAENRPTTMRGITVMASKAKKSIVA